ncbi:MAG: hypothetical protein KAS62_12525 [Candidatus Delongbacteria bacterium]|nr:hypothetical protein [Candidatus Delongbacteria bacterium]
MDSQKLDIDNIVSFVMKENKIPNIQLQKYYKLKWFFDALKENHFTFQEPSTWHDPFEDFISKLSNSREDTFVNNFNITDGIFAMSTISKRSECDGMWRNFADTDGVLIYTTSRKIIKSIVTFLLDNGCCKDNKSFTNDYDVKKLLSYTIKIQKIRYMSDLGIANFFKSATEQPYNDYIKLSLDALSIKRMEYDYESEYRVFLIAELLNLNKVQFLNIGYFKETITKIILSPNADSTQVDRLTSKLIREYSIDCEIIEQSKLYNIGDFKEKYNLG